MPLVWQHYEPEFEWRRQQRVSTTVTLKLSCAAPAADEVQFKVKPGYRLTCLKVCLPHPPAFITCDGSSTEEQHLHWLCVQTTKFEKIISAYRQRKALTGGVRFQIDGQALHNDRTPGDTQLSASKRLAVNGRRGYMRMLTLLLAKSRTGFAVCAQLAQSAHCGMPRFELHSHDSQQRCSGRGSARWRRHRRHG